VQEFALRDVSAHFPCYCIGAASVGALAVEAIAGSSGGSRRESPHSDIVYHDCDAVLQARLRALFDAQDKDADGSISHGELCLAFVAARAQGGVDAGVDAASATAMSVTGTRFTFEAFVRLLGPVLTQA
jgi:hypothetical protein